MDKFEQAFVIVTYNSDKYIEQCVASILNNYSGSGRYAIVIVDNSSTDRTRDILSVLSKKYSSIYLRLLDENLGFGAANNVGFNTVDAEFYTLLNADAWLVADSMSLAKNALSEESNVAIVGIPLVFPDGSPQTSVYQFSSPLRWMLVIIGVRNLISRIIKVPAMAWLFAGFSFGREFVLNQTKPSIDLSSLDLSNYDGKLRDVDWVCGAAMMFSGNFIKKTGGFDPEIFLYGEDEDICIEAHRLGQRVVAINVPPVVHQFGWGENKFNEVVAKLKYDSLKYFIRKNVQGELKKYLMLIFLPIYVYGIKRFYLVWK